MTAPYGMELILDLHECDPATFTRRSIERFLENLCDDILQMERQDLHFWDDDNVAPEDQQTDPRTKGTTAIQFILTSNVTIHCLELLRSVYINVFSCEQFDPAAATDFCVTHFRAAKYNPQVISRT